MEEFRTELDCDRQAVSMQRPDSPADAFAGVENGNVDAGIVETSRARESSDAGANDDYARDSEILSTTIATSSWSAARAMSACDTIPTQHSSSSTITTRRI